MAWSKVGTPAHSFAIHGNRLAALTPNRQAVYTRDPGSGVWTRIGGPAHALVGGGWDLFAVAPGNGDIWRYDGDTWIRAGGPGAQFVGICNAAYALTPDRGSVYRYDRYANSWTRIGGPAHSIIAGGSRVFASTPDQDAIWEYSRVTNRWTQIGGPGSQWVGAAGTVFGLTPDRSAVYRYEGQPLHWTKVGGPAERLIGGGSFLYATQPGTGDLWRYSGTGQQWTRLGSPGADFVATGRTIYGLTPDRSEVWQYTDHNSETERLHGLIHSAFDPPEFGRRSVRGFLVKRLGAQVLADFSAGLAFQPLSTLKLLPYLYAITEIDRGNASLDKTFVSWVGRTTGTPAEMADTSCLTLSDPDTASGSAPLRDALPTMMWESHNRTLDALLDTYGPSNITARGRDLGLAETEMYFGCPQPSGTQAPWADNVSTLEDFARLFEGVETLRAVESDTSRQIFLDNMIRLDASPGTSYSSPITGRTTGPLINELLRPIVAREAGRGSSSLVNEFMQHVTLRGKGGSGGPQGNEIGMSDFLEVSLPIKTKTGRIATQKYLVGWFVGQLRSVGPTLQAAEDEQLATFRTEIHAGPIRDALADW